MKKRLARQAMMSSSSSSSSSSNDVSNPTASISKNTTFVGQEKENLLKTVDGSSSSSTSLSSSSVSSASSFLGASKKNIKIYGVDISYLHSNALFLLLSAGHILFSVIFAALQEKVTLTKGFIYPKFMTVVQTFTFTICAWLELQMSGGELGTISAPRAPIWNYFILSLLTAGGMYFTNWGLEYLSYPTRIIFKSAKPVPTMLLEWLYVGKRFSQLEVTNVGILTLGIILFSSGEARDGPSFHLYGVLFMVLGVLLDALTSNYEKKNIFNFNASHCEAMFYASLMGTLWSLGTLMITETNDMFEAMAFFLYNPLSLFWLFLSSIGGYLSVTFVLLLIKLYSTTYAECVKGLRKVVSVGLSYLFFADNKPFGDLHWYGMFCFILSSGVSIYESYLIDKLKHQHKPKVVVTSEQKHS